MLSFNVAQLLKEGVGAFRHYHLSGELLEIDENNPGPVSVEGEISFIRTPRGILAQGHASLALVQTCRRCLELLTSQTVLQIEEEYIPSIDIETGATLPLTDEDEPELVIDAHHILDVTEVLRQLAVVALLTPALCKSDCKGLCPVCGANLNYETCTCSPAHLDPRLAALAALLGDRDTE